MSDPQRHDYREGHDLESLQTAGGEQALAREALADYQRAERAAASARDPLEDMLGDLGSSAQAAALLRQLLLVCLPPKQYGHGRRMRSGFYRMVAFAWRLAPELLEGCRTDKDVADLLGLSAVAFFKHLEHVDAILARSAGSSRKRDKRGSFYNPPAG